MKITFILLYVFASLLTVGLVIFNTYLIRKHINDNKKKLEDLSKYDLLSEEDKKIYQSLPTNTNFEYVRLEEITSPIQLKEGEVALTSLNMREISLSKKHREISGGTGSFGLLGIRLGGSKRDIKTLYEQNSYKVNRTIVSNKKVYVDTEDLMYQFRLKGIILLEYDEGLTLRMVSNDYSKSSIFITFKNKKDLILLLRIYYTYLSLGKIYHGDNLEEEKEEGKKK